MLLSDDISLQKTNFSGSIEVICGSMFSGKTEELISRLNNAQAAGFSVEIFRPAIDTRYGLNTIVSHNATSMQALSVSTSAEISDHSKLASVVGIDEAQFFDSRLPEICSLLANKGIKVIVAGLDMDFKAQPFGTMPALMAIADSVTKLHAKCVICGQAALYSYRTVPGDTQVLLGETESYEARCRLHFGS